MKVFVVMGNDFPDSVFDSEDAAEAACDSKRAERERSPTGHRAIYWRIYEFTLNRG